MKVRKAIVLGGGGFVGTHLASRLSSEGYWVRCVDLKLPEFGESSADEFLTLDLRERESVATALRGISGDVEIYQLAADMGGAGYIFSGENDASVMHNSVLINALVLEQIVALGLVSRSRIFYSSSACIYPEEIQSDPTTVNLQEHMAYPANPDSEYGWEKLFSERLFFAFARNYGLQVRVGRFHNVYGPLGTWTGGREKAPAAICRKVAEAEEHGMVEIWGSGEQTRSFLYIEDCVNAVLRFMRQEDFEGPLNIGSEEMVTIRELVEMVTSISGKTLGITNVKGPVGVNGRNSNNELIREHLNWEYQWSLREGMTQLYSWVEERVNEAKKIE